MMTKQVRVVGGPDHGRELAVPVDAEELFFHELPPQLLNFDNPAREHVVEVRKGSIPITKLTEGGYVAYWSDRR